ncbi:unnamed protein product [Euphydryas editha]|uniref:Uncharacterized protein n=1 Tax=Euphydryas editha TaxID=104508 RepID=A0AAU9ULQ3_EUPED|nr:unnamed protein product [Euphydryas editha]
MDLVIQNATEVHVSQTSIGDMCASHVKLEDGTEEKRQENAGELEVEKLSFVNQDYPGWDPFSASGSSDEDQPTTFQKPQNIELEPRQLQVDTVLPTTEEHQSQAADCNGSVGKDQKKYFCFYCETHVLNFSRHIIRNHYLEVDVKKILALPKKSQIRRNLIIQLKKRENYISNLARCERPMKLEKYLNESDYLPYQNCLGFYPRKQLWTHNNKCNPEALGAHMQAEAQNLMCLNSPHTPSIILQKVFSRMRADEISFVVKQDALICKFGENHTKRHVGEHFINVISSKMRQLAKIFIEIQKIKPDIRTFVDALSSQNYNVLIAAAKVVAKYDENLHRYCSPTIAMNICTSIKQCCNIAITEILKMKPSIKYAEKQADLKTLVQLIESNWTSDVLNLNKWNKVTIVTLASDLKLLKNHLCSTAQNAAVQLKDENIQDIGAYKLLAETIFCRILLLNRLRPGQLQSLSLRTYVKNEHKEYQYEEIHHTLTATEKILFQRLKCVVIRGNKRSSGVPVLISTDVQRDLDLLISLREKYIYVSNKFLFAKPSARTFLCGYGVLQKHVKLSRAKNPDAISSTKLKKYLATLTQLFNMTKNDIEQLSNYLGYTAGVHTQNYRLHGNIFQTAKLSKLLMLIEDGQADLFKGKSLDEININMDEDLEVEGLQREENLDFAENENTLQESDMVADLSTTTVLVPETPPMNHLSKKTSKRRECDALKTLHPELLQNKNWRKIKVFVKNYYCKH